MAEEKKGVVEKHALDSVPEADRVSWTGPAGILAGIAGSLTVMVLGFILLGSHSLKDTIIITVISWCLVSFLMSFGGIRGQKEGRPLTSLLRDSLGISGSRYFYSLAIIFCGITYFAILTEITAGVFFSFTKFGNLVLWRLGFGLFFILSAAIGFKVMSFVNKIIMPLVLILTTWAIIYVTSKVGTAGMWEYQPAKPQTIVQGVAWMVGMASFFMILAADYTRYCRKKTDAVIAVWVGTVPMCVFLCIGGAILGLVAKEYITGGPASFPVALANLGLPGLALIIVFLMGWSTAVTDAYIAGLGLTNMFNLKAKGRVWVTVVGGGIGLLLSMVGFLQNMTMLAGIWGTIAAPVIGIFVAEVVVGKKWEATPNFNWLGMATWAAGAGVALLTKMVIPFFMFPVNGAIVSFILYVLLRKYFMKRKEAA